MPVSVEHLKLLLFTGFSVLSNPASAQNVSYLGLCCGDICPRIMLNIDLISPTFSCQ